MPRLPSPDKEKIRIKRKIRKEKLHDEESLYYIIERDLDREVLFPEHDGWSPQVDVGRGRVDFAVKYGDKILGLEVKKGFPRLDDFRQVSKYSTSLDAVFLAYHSDAAAQALFLSEYQRKYIEIGLLSIALFRSHCIRQGILSKRQDNRTWDENFNEERYWNDGWKYVFREDSLAATVFKDGCLWVTYDKNQRRMRDSVKLKLTKTEWNSLAMLYALTEATGIYKFHNIDKLSQLMKEKMG